MSFSLFTTTVSNNDILKEMKTEMMEHKTEYRIAFV